MGGREVWIVDHSGKETLYIGLTYGDRMEIRKDNTDLIPKFFSEKKDIILYSVSEEEVENLIDFAGYTEYGQPKDKYKAKR